MTRSTLTLDLSPDNPELKLIFRCYPWSGQHIAYGTDLSPTTLTDQDAKVRDTYKTWNIREKLLFDPWTFCSENNYETAIREFIGFLDKGMI